MPSSEKTSKILRILGIIAIVIFMLIWLGSCAFFLKGMGEESAKAWGPDKSEYVGTWACYLAKTDEGKADGAGFRPESIGEVNSFIRLMDNGEAELVAKIGDSPSITECWWTITHRDREEGTETGVLVSGKEEGFENPYRYVINSESKANFIDEQLAEGHLVIDYGYRKEYFEKISNDPSYQPWLTVGNAPEVNASGGVNADSETPVSNASTGAVPIGAISWDEAKNHVGESVTIYGKVESVTYASTSKGRPTFINIGAGYPDKNRLTVTIWGENRGAFSPSPEAMYEGKTLCVTGEVYLYDGACNIEVSSPDQIAVL